jgi:hypothetical protein
LGISAMCSARIKKLGINGCAAGDGLGLQRGSSALRGGVGRSRCELNDRLHRHSGRWLALTALADLGG